MDPMDLQSDPFREADWRWQLAVALAEGTGGPFRQCPDPLVQSARRFWQQWIGCQDETDRQLLRGRMPAMYLAFIIYSDPKSVTRNAVEARLLAGELTEDIALKCSLSSAAVRLFEDVFFDVRSRLKSADFILNQVIGPRLRIGGEWSYDIIWKFFSFIGGPLIADELMDASGSASRPASPAQVAGFLSEAARAAVRRQLAVAARTVATGSRQAVAQLGTANTLLTNEKRNAEETPRDVISMHIDAMLKEIPWCVGDDAQKVVPASLLEHDSHAAELRDDEVLLLAAGKEVPEVAALKDIKMPPPRPKDKINFPK